MKKLVFLFLSLLTAGSVFQACDDSKTYAEMLEDEKNAVNKFLKDSAINVISLDDFERNDSTTNLARNEYVAFSNGVYMQIVNRGSEAYVDTFATNNEICVRYVEENMMERTLVGFNVFMPDYSPVYYRDPLVFRYVLSGTSAYGTITDPDRAWYENYMYGNNDRSIPSGWLLAMPYIRNGAHVRLIIPSKMGHSSSKQYVVPYYYDLRSLTKAKS